MKFVILVISLTIVNLSTFKQWDLNKEWNHYTNFIIGELKISQPKLTQPIEPKKTRSNKIKEAVQQKASEYTDNSKIETNEVIGDNKPRSSSMNIHQPGTGGIKAYISRNSEGYISK